MFKSKSEYQGKFAYCDIIAFFLCIISNSSEQIIASGKIIVLEYKNIVVIINIMSYISVRCKGRKLFILSFSGFSVRVFREKLTAESFLICRKLAVFKTFFGGSKYITVYL